MDSIGKVMNSMLKNLGIENIIKENEVLLIWDEIVGSRIADNSQPEKIQHGVLFVKVKNDSWRNELLFKKKVIIGKLNNRLGKKIVKEIRFN